MSEARDKMIAALKEIVLPTLRNMGFRGSFPHFRRERDEQLDLLTCYVSEFDRLQTIETTGFILSRMARVFTLTRRWRCCRYCAHKQRVTGTDMSTPNLKLPSIRSSESGHRDPVAIHAPRGPGRWRFGATSE